MKEKERKMTENEQNSTTTSTNPLGVIPEVEVTLVTNTRQIAFIMATVDVYLQAINQGVLPDCGDEMWGDTVVPLMNSLEGILNKELGDPSQYIPA